jgi:hypothetical protein
MQFKFLLVDIETSGVLCNTESITVANTIAQGIFNIKVAVVPMYIFWTRPQWKDLNFDSDFLSYDDTSGPEIAKTAQHLITDEFIRKRNLSIARRKFLIRLEGFLNSVLFKTVVGFDPTAMSYIENQLIQSDTEKHQYPDSIKEYAQYTEISEAQAYSELKMFAESQGRMKLRLFACYNKYSNKINQTDSEQVMNDVYAEAMKDIFINARL